MENNNLDSNEMDSDNLSQENNAEEPELKKKKKIKKEKKKKKKIKKEKKKKKKEKGKKTKADKNKNFRVRKTVASVVFYYIIALSVIALAFGSIYAIMDAIQPTGKWDWFLSISPGLKFVIIGAFGFLFFVLLTTAWILFRRGNRFIFKLLYPDIERPKIKRENSSAKVITAGLLISVFIIAAGVVISILQGMFSGGTNEDFLSFISTLPGGLLTMLISLLILSITLLIVIFVWIWENGYNFVLNKIVKYNAPKDEEFKIFTTRKRKITTTLVYVITFVALIILAFGIIWAILDAFQPTGKWESFTLLPITIKITVIASLASLLFILLILSLLFYRQGRIAIGKIIYKEVEYKHGIPTKADKILTIGLLTFLNIIILGFAIWGINYLVLLTGSEGETTLIDYLQNLPNGILVILASSIVIAVVWGIIYGIRFSKAYYHGFLKGIIKMRVKITKLAGGEEVEKDGEDKVEEDNIE